LGSAPDPRAHSAPPDALAVFKGPTSRGKEGKRARRKGRRGTRPQIFWPRTVPGISQLASHLTDTGKIIGLVDK